MHISRLELDNIKSYESSIFEFSRGTTAITGENGAGKTTIIEAIAWTLFDLLEYKKDDFLRRGAKKGSVRITFESGLDGREYIVYRDTGAGYHVTDPRLQTRIADKKEEVFRFLWLHLGLEPGTDLKSLFRQAIGVPQGTFTAIFLEGATERKVAFDRLLKVEEYRQAAEKLRETSRYLDQNVAAVRENIARAEGELQHSEKVETEHAAVQRQSLQLTGEITKVTAELVEKQSLVKQLDEQERRLSDQKIELQKAVSSREKAAIMVQQAESALVRASEAYEKLEKAKVRHELHIAALKNLDDLEQTRQQRDALRAQSAQIDAETVNVKAERKRLEHRINDIRAAKEEIARLQLKAAEQLAIEKEIDTLRNGIAAARTADERILSINAELGRLREKYLINKSAVGEAEKSSVQSDNLHVLEKQHAQLVTNLAKLNASLERDEKFQIEVSDGLCPIFSARCLNLQEGISLDEFLSGRSLDLRSQITDLEKQHQDLAIKLGSAREGQKYQTALKNHLDRKGEIEAEGKELNAKKSALEKQRNELAQLERQMSDAQARLRSLADPSARIRVLEKELNRETELTAELKVFDADLTRLESENKTLADQLVEFKSFDEQWTRFIRERDATIGEHRIFIANEAEATAFETRKSELEERRSRILEVSTDIESAEKALSAAGGDYDTDRHKAERTELLIAERRLAEIRATSDAVKKREEQLAADLDHFKKLRENLGQEFKEKDRLESVSEATAFIRDTLKEAAPRVARNYVYHVSLEANQMFREITGNAERTLKWVEDYSIVLEEEGFERPFQSLSGGEQMAAALSVRLALLKQLTDIRLAFFDEPTTNMDAERRENLAMQISRITHFDQLFVISHDETFDSYVDNVIAVHRI